MCTDCPAGRYSDTTGAASCKLCEENTYSDTAGAEKCESCVSPAFTTRAGAQKCEMCPVGTYRVVPQNGAPNAIARCAECPSFGAMCSGGNISAMEGFYVNRDEDGFVEVFECPDGECSGE